MNVERVRGEAPRRGALGRCQCDQCGAIHWDLVPKSFDDVSVVEGQLFFVVKCDDCAFKGMPAANRRRHQAKRKALGGE